MTTFEERRPISIEQHKVQQREKLNAVFGDFNHFSELISKKNICGLQFAPSSPRRAAVASPPQPSKSQESTVLSSVSASSSTAPKPEESMTTEELLQSMQSILEPVKEPVAGPLKPREAHSSRGNPSTTHRSNGTSSGSSRRDREKERDRDRDREHRDRDARDSRDSRDRRRDSERDRRSSKTHHERRSHRDRDEHRCSSVASTSAAAPPGRSSNERDEERPSVSEPSKHIDSLFGSSSATKRAHRASKSPQEDLFGDEEVKRKRKKVSEEAKWKETPAGNDDVQSPDSGIGAERGSSEEASEKPQEKAPEKVPEKSAAERPAEKAEDAVEDDIDMPIDDILKMMTSLVSPQDIIPKLPYKTLADLQNAIRPPPPVLQPMRPLPQATNRATSPMSPPKRPLAAVSPMRPLRTQEPVKTPSPPTPQASSPYSSTPKTKISLNLAMLPSDAVRRLKKEHARLTGGRHSRGPNSPELERPLPRSKRPSGERERGERSRLEGASWSPRMRQRSRTPEREPPKKKSPPKPSSNRLEVPLCASMPPSKPPSKPPSRNEDRTPSPTSGRKRRRPRMEKIFGVGCCAPKHVPVEPALPDIDVPRDPVRAQEFIQSVAKDIKHQGDQVEHSKHKLKKLFLYIEAAITFIYATAYMDPTDQAPLYNQIAQTVTFLKQIQKQCVRSQFVTEQEKHFMTRIQLLVRLCQSCLAFHLYDSMTDSHSKRFEMIQKMDSKRTMITPELRDLASSSSVSNESINVNAQLYTLQVTQLKFCTHLYWSHKMWKDLQISMSPADIFFKKELDRVCDPIFPGASLRSMAEYFFTALSWLRDEYREGCVYSTS
ncbi:hypothetical protein QR680_013454 [Steinernema hermaphroditum]|uniref:AF4/FMR2 C-terminal homology domain-containing protein n=1 Tax=Steinernema hermaphroditum TaxID=289476 RepID=A0AA39I7M8_9BILA|nr:hypothetical protein QR680_013454 [Steinernema hermaphroditum]